MVRTGWSHTIGEHPDFLEVFEDLRRGGVIYLRWRTVGKDGKRRDVLRSTRIPTIRDGRGRVLKEKEQEAMQRGRDKYNALLASGALGTITAQAAAAERADQSDVDEERKARLLTIAEGRALAFDPSRGKWPVDKPYRRELDRALTQASAVWGAHRRWSSLKKSDFVELWRKTFAAYRARGVSGFRGSEVVIARLLTVAEWLREEGHILPVKWLPWKTWRQQIVEDLEEIGEAPRVVARPRYTTDELRALLRTAHGVDPRWHLLLTLGLGLRLGQVVRATRACLDRETGEFNLAKTGRKKKRAATRLLTDAQLAVFDAAASGDGYLAGLEAAYQATGRDYPIFFGYALAKKVSRKSTTVATLAERPTLTPRTLGEFLKRNEELAGIAHVTRRGWTGFRRAMVDAFKKLHVSRDGMKEGGGWADTQVPDAVYADDEQQAAREEARAAIAKLMGEGEMTP